MSNGSIAALSYQQRGFSVIPIQPSEKKPLVHWEQYQSGRATESEINAWWAKSPDANVGIVTGVVSGLVVIDVDTPEAKEKVKELVPGFDFTTVPRSRTGKGWQLFFQHPGITIPNRAGVIPGLDVRGDGGYVVAPPSIHPNGKVYRWEVPINEYLPELPVELYRLISSPRPMVGTLSANDSTQCKLWPASRKVNAMKLFLADGQTLMTRLSLPSHRQRKLVREESI